MNWPKRKSYTGHFSVCEFTQLTHAYTLQLFPPQLYSIVTNFKLLHSALVTRFVELILMKVSIHIKAQKQLQAYVLPHQAHPEVPDLHSMKYIRRIQAHLLSSHSTRPPPEPLESPRAFFSVQGSRTILSAFSPLNSRSTLARGTSERVTVELHRVPRRTSRDLCDSGDLACYLLNSKSTSCWCALVWSVFFSNNCVTIGTFENFVNIPLANIVYC